MKLNADIIKWARERSSFSLEEVSKKVSVKKEIWEKWENGERSPTQKQLEKISKKLYVPFGYLFLSEPPEEKLPIADFRTVNNKELSKPSIHLLDVIYDAQRKQDWLREEKIEDDEDKVIVKKNYTDKQIIEKITTLLDMEHLRKKAKGYEEFLRALIERLDEKEFLVIRNGIVGNTTRRPLDFNEFQGFVLFDEYAPSIFINGKDYKSRQIFTLLHELVHLFLNESALDAGYNLQTERKCNKIAAEILLPKKELEKNFNINNNINNNIDNNIDDNIEKIAKAFKVSRFVVLIKAKQSELINKETFNKKWEDYENGIKDDIKKQKDVNTAGGGNFYKNIKFRAGGENFLRRVFYSTLAGETLYRDAYQLTGLTGTTFDTYYKGKGVIS